MMFNPEHALEIYRVDRNSITLTSGTSHEEGALIGMAFVWPSAMQPNTLECLAEVVFFSDVPQEVYLCCDIVHTRLMTLVQEARLGFPLSAEKVISDHVLRNQAREAESILRKIAAAKGITPSAASTLGVTDIARGNFIHSNHFYALEGDKASPLLLAAMQFDPS